MTAQWLRWCMPEGDLVPTGKERADEADQRAEAERLRADKADQRAERLAQKLRELGIEE
jgi:hypothetical protein